MERAGERVVLILANTTTMWHPVHLHGHTFALGGTGARKDTVMVLPGQTQKLIGSVDDPLTHVYHAEAGMIARFAYRT